MAIILSLETSSGICSVAIHENEKLLSLNELHKDQAHASKLAPLIEQTVRAADLSMDLLTAVAISSGPGSYTGLRIGTSTAKGLCYARSVPLIAIGTLDIMVASVSRYNTQGMLLCPMIDARRMEVYCSLFDARGNMLGQIEAKVIDNKSFEQQLDAGPVMFFGNGSDKCKEILQHENAFFVPDIHPGGASLGYLAFQKFLKNELEDVVKFEPFYLKEFIAKLPTKIISTFANKS